MLCCAKLHTQGAAQGAAHLRAAHDVCPVPRIFLNTQVHAVKGQAPAVCELLHDSVGQGVQARRKGQAARHLGHNRQVAAGWGRVAGGQRRRRVGVDGNKARLGCVPHE